MNKKDVVERISQLRSAKNMSARELSLMIGKNEAYINRLESARTFEPSVSALLAIIEACDSTVAEFFYPVMSDYKQDMQIVALFKDLTAEKKKVILDLLKLLKA